MSQPWLTVVMPVHRPGHWLDEALASIPSSSMRSDIAVIIRDSTPEGPCDKHIAPHRSRLSIDYAHLPELPSWTRKTNLGVLAARSRFVCTLHQDDMWLPTRGEVARRMIAQYPDAALLLTGAHIVDECGKKMGSWEPPLAKGVQDPSEYRDRLLVQNSIAMPCPIFNRDAYLASGGLDEGLWYTPDWDLWLKLADHGDVVFEPQPTACFRLHGSSLTMTGDRGEMRRELEAVLARYRFADANFAPIGRASLRINCALAGASIGTRCAFVNALGAFVGLGLVGTARYLKYSRLIQRLLPRMRLRSRGAL